MSSSSIRQALTRGEVETAKNLLGRPFELRGQVVKGDSRGRLLGFPTANLQVQNEVIPATGVYLSELIWKEGSYPSVTNVGVKPTFGLGADCVVEAHVLNFQKDLYGESVKLRFLKRLRSEMKFANVAELKEQISQDVQMAKTHFELP